MIIAESLGTLPQRVGRYMNNRKIGKCHQNILVFYKGNPKNIKNNYKKLDFTNLDESTNI
jgi:4-alpha-glucanotransferase